METLPFRLSNTYVYTFIPYCLAISAAVSGSIKPALFTVCQQDNHFTFGYYLSNGLPL
jgi:hypothetical protein